MNEQAKGKSRGFTLIEVMAAVAVIAILVMVLFPAFVTRPVKYLVDFGTHYTVSPVPPSLVGKDGWILPEAMSEDVYDALTKTVGPVDQSKTGTLRKWRNKDSKGKSYEVMAGEFTTVPSPVNAAVLTGLATIYARNDLDGFKYRQVRIRFWTETARDVDKPGGFYLAVELATSPDQNKKPVTVTDPRAQQIVLKDLLDALAVNTGTTQGPTPL
jgi:prepilin-type N-terminal cleavage/methylation domain-containing protein